MAINTDYESLNDTHLTVTDVTDSEWNQFFIQWRYDRNIVSRGLLFILHRPSSFFGSSVSSITCLWLRWPLADTSTHFTLVSRRPSCFCSLWCEKWLSYDIVHLTNVVLSVPPPPFKEGFLEKPSFEQSRFAKWVLDRSRDLRSRKINRFETSSVRIN